MIFSEFLFTIENINNDDGFNYDNLRLLNSGYKINKFNTFDAIDCEVDLLADSPPRSKRHHRTTSYLEETDTHTRCNAKTFYWSEGFMKTDDGNHYGEVLNETLKYCFQKKKCKKSEPYIS